MFVGTPTRDLFTYTVERIAFLALVLVVVIVAIWIYRRIARTADILVAGII
jgi:hypothetical protein